MDTENSDETETRQSKFIRLLRDPSWQFVGAFLALVGIIVTFVFSYFSGQSPPNSFEDNRLVVDRRYETQLSRIPQELEGRFKLLIDDQEVKDLRLHTFQFANSSNSPILPTHFIEPLRVESSKNRKIISVQSQSDANTFFISSKIFDREIESDWTKKDEFTFELEPLLLNPGDGFEIVIYTTEIAGIEDDLDSSDSFSWSCRVANVICPASRKVVPSEDNNLMLQVSIRHSGIGLYFLIIFVVVFFLFMLWLLMSSNRVDTITYTGIAFILFSMLLSLTTAEIIADWLFRGNNLQVQPAISGILLMVQFVWIVYISIPIIRAIYRRFFPRDRG